MKRWMGAIGSALVLAGCGSNVAYEPVMPKCGPNWSVPQYRTQLLVGIGTIRIEVKDAAGNPVPRARVGLRVKEFRSILCASPLDYLAGEDGVKTFERVRTGLYTAVLYRGETTPDAAPSVLAERDLEVKTGETATVSFTRPAE